MADHLLPLFLHHLRQRLVLPLLLGTLAVSAVLVDHRLALLADEDVARLTHRATIGGMAFCPDSKILATGNLDSGLYLWDVATGKELWRAESVEACGLAFSPDGRSLAAGGWKGIVRIWDVKGCNKLRECSIKAVDKDIYILAFSPDGRFLAVGGRSHWVQLLDVHSGKVVRRFDGQGRIHSVAFSPDGTLLACGTTGDRVHVWVVATGEEARPFRGKEIRGGCVAFSPDGRILAAGQSQDTIWCREVATGEVLRRISMSGQPRRRTELVYALSFSPDGRALAAGGGPVVKVWGLATGQLLGEFEGHQGAVYGVCFSPDGKRLAAGGSDKTAILWDVPRRMKKEKISTPDLSAEKLERLWKDLADGDVPTAYRAVWTLRAAPEQAVPFLSERLRSATAFDERRVKQFIADLDSDRFAVRQQAETELGQMGWVVESPLRRARQDASSLEMRLRLTHLVQAIETAEFSPTWLRVARAIAVLEQIGAPSARRILKTLARGMSEARLTREAGTALRRLQAEPRPSGSGKPTTP